MEDCLQTAHRGEDAIVGMAVMGVEQQPLLPLMAQTTWLTNKVVSASTRLQSTVALLPRYGKGCPRTRILILRTLEPKKPATSKSKPTGVGVKGPESRSRMRRRRPGSGRSAPPLPNGTTTVRQVYAAKPRTMKAEPRRTWSLLHVRAALYP